MVEHRYPRVRPVALHIGVEGRDLPCKKGLSFGQWLAADRVVGGQIIPVNREFIVEPSQYSSKEEAFKCLDLTIQPVGCSDLIRAFLTFFDQLMPGKEGHYNSFEYAINSLVLVEELEGVHRSWLTNNLALLSLALSSKSPEATAAAWKAS